MRRLNKRTLLSRLQQVGVASRADLAKSLGMSQPTAGKIADELLDLGVLEEVDAETMAEEKSVRRAIIPNGRLGRPGRMLRLDRSQSRFLGIQLGVVDTQLAVLTIGGNDLDQWTLQVGTPNSAEKWVRQLELASREIKAKGFWGVLVSVPGIVDEPEGRVVFSPNLHWTEQVELPKLIGKIWPAPVLLVQEERALALGHQSVEPAADDFLLVDFGQGVGGAVVVEGKLYANPLPISGELGHTPVLGNQRPCGCGAIGCVETLVSRRGLLQSYDESDGHGAHSWMDLTRHLAEKGIVPWLAEALNAAGVIIAGAINVLGLRRVIITGSLTELNPAVIEYLSGTVIKGAMWGRFGEVVCQAAPRHRTAGLVAVGIDRLITPMTSILQSEKTHV